MTGFLWDGLGHEEFLSGVVWSRPSEGVVPVEANEEDINTNRVNPDTLYRRTGIRIAISKFIVANGTPFANRIQAVYRQFHSPRTSPLAFLPPEPAKPTNDAIGC